MSGQQLPFGDISPCEIVWGYGESGAAYLGAYLGEVKLTQETGVQKVEEEASGDAAVDAVFTGSSITLEVPMTRSTLDQLNEVLLAGGVQGTTPNEYIYLKNHIGGDQYSKAKAIVIKPICEGIPSTDPAKWIQLYKCYPVPGLDLAFNRSTQRVFPIKFTVFPSRESGTVGKFGTVGMPAGSKEFGY